MVTLTRKVLVHFLVEQRGIEHFAAQELVDAVFKEMVNTLASGEPISLHQFGRFTLRQKRARPGRVPKTGEPKTISARTVVTFKPSDKLLARIAWKNNKSQA